MKFIRLIILLLAFCIGLSGCDLLVTSIEESYDIVDMDENLGEKPVTFEITDYGLEITAGTNFRKNEDSGAWNLQITDGSSYISVMAYKYIDLADGQSPKDLYDYHNNDIFSRRQNVSVIEDESTEILTKKTIVKTGYSAETDGIKNYYDSYLVNFEDDGIFAWVLVTSLPSHMETNSGKFRDIVYTLSIIP